MLRCTPRSLRGNGVSILWDKTLQPFVQKLTDFSTNTAVGIRLVTADRPICFHSVYSPTHMGCTDVFKECVDYMDAVLGRLAFDNDVIIMGDFNADSEGSSLSSTPVMSKDKYCYLRRNQQTSQTTNLSAQTSSVSYNLYHCLLPQFNGQTDQS